MLVFVIGLQMGETGEKGIKLSKVGNYVPF